jgi:hypothetical protein
LEVVRVSEKTGINIKDEKEVLHEVSAQLEKAKLGAYMDLMQNPFRMITLNFFAGLARGFGFAVGFAILGAVMLYMIQRLVILNLPIIGGIVTEIVKLVKLNIR